ncbi:PRC-barrel domain-containing protein [Actinocatenispora sera]|uniref:PRC-barrel domain-containing protein n=1 Tax=Actinocatenispora sera TaxID=390989 RepID=UPI000A00E743|nr:PRC-barrel domain-containing protein [Actinocatenispora sera]
MNSMSPRRSADPSGWRGKEVLLRDGDRLGKLVDVYYDADSDDPVFLCVKPRLFSSKQLLVPADKVHETPAGLTVDWSEDDVRGAPTTKPGVGLSGVEELRVFRHYGMEFTLSTADNGRRLVRH